MKAYIFYRHADFFETIILAMKILELKPGQLPIVIRLRLLSETKEYVLLKTKQDKLLLNKSNEEVQARTA